MKYLKAIILFLALPLMSSCIYDEDPQEQPNLPGEVRISIRTNALSRPTKAISAVSENHVHDLYMLIYNADGTFLKYKKATQISDIESDGHLKAASFPLDTDETLENVRVRLFANLEDNVQGLTTLLSGLQAGVSMIDGFKPVYDAELPWNTSSDSDFQPMPMYGGSLHALQDLPITLVEGNNPTVSFILLRATARVNVVLEDEILAVSSVDIYNTLPQGHVMSLNLDDGYKATAPYIDGFEDHASTSLHFESDNPVQSFVNTVYVAETPGSQEYPVFLVVGVTDGTYVKYSRVDLIDNDGEYLDVLRNFSYNFNIRFRPTGVLAGYDTVEEAMSHKTENMDVEIQYVNDSSLDVLVSDGYYLLGMNKDCFNIPAEGGRADFVVYSDVPATGTAPVWSIDMDNIKVNGTPVSGFTDLKVYKRNDPSVPTYSGTENYNYYLSLELLPCATPRTVSFDVLATDKVKWTVRIVQGE